MTKYLLFVDKANVTHKEIADIFTELRGKKTYYISQPLSTVECLSFFTIDENDNRLTQLCNIFALPSVFLNDDDIKYISYRDYMDNHRIPENI